MNLTLSVFFSPDRVYTAVVEPTNRGLSLANVDSTVHPVDLENPESETSQLAKAELEEILISTGDIVNSINITVPSDSVLISQFPGNENISSEEAKQLLNLEIRQSYPQFNTEDFSSSVFALAPKLDGSQMLMAIIVPKKMYETARSLVSVLKAPVNRMEISHVNSHAAFLYSYPEQHDKTVILFGMSDEFVDVSVLKEGKAVYYNLASCADELQVAALVESEFDKVMMGVVDNIDSAYFFGHGLNKAKYELGEMTVSAIVPEYGKLNAFRMMRTDIDQRNREYCSRVAHIFPACVGACFPAYHKKLKLH